MGHGKETPRQKMIGMMYLVLTAMLALNVSNEVLNAFINIDEGLISATNNTQVKNDIIYADFTTKALVNPTRVGPYNDKAQLLKKKTDELCNYILESKKAIVIDAEGPESQAAKGEEVHVELVDKKDKTDSPARVMVGPEGVSGRGYVLQKMIDDYVELLTTEFVADDYIVKNIKKTLSTEPVKHADQMLPWARANFEHLPLAGVIAILSGIENNIRNVETDVLNYLHNQIDAGSFSFNFLESVVIPNSNYVMRGQDYEADIFIAASDTTSDPIVLIGEYEEITDAEGNVTDYEMTRVADTLPIEGGVAKLRRSATSLGDHTYRGLILLQNPDGSYTRRPFERSYTVAEKQVVVSPTAMNVFYIGLNNPVEISVPGIAGNLINATMTNGTIRRRGNEFIANPGRGKESIITVYAEVDGERQNMGNKKFRVQSVPHPVAQIGGVTGGDIRASVLKAQRVVTAELSDFLFDIDFRVVSFNLYTTERGFVREARSSSHVITDQQRDILNSVSIGQRVVIDEVRVRMPGDEVVSVPSISLKVQ